MGNELMSICHVYVIISYYLTYKLMMMMKYASNYYYYYSKQPAHNTTNPTYQYQSHHFMTI